MGHYNPLHSMHGLYGLERERVQRLEVEVECQPQPLPPADGRRLSVDESPYATREQRGSTNKVSALAAHESQQQAFCMLLQGIPLEIRSIIFCLILEPNATFHMVSRVKRVAHLKCDEKPDYLHPSTCNSCWKRYRAKYTASKRDRRWTKLSHIDLSLLQTCRQAYREGIHFLYSRPVFQFDHPETLNWFAQTVRPQRLAVISKLEIGLTECLVDYWTPRAQKIPFREEAPVKRDARNCGDLLRYWDPAWRTILGQMTGLKHLMVTLFGEAFDKPAYIEPVLKPLLELRRLMTFGMRLLGESRFGDEYARLQILKEKSETLRLIFERATSEEGNLERKSAKLNWGPPQRTSRQEWELAPESGVNSRQIRLLNLREQKVRDLMNNEMVQLEYY